MTRAHLLTMDIMGRDNLKMLPNYLEAAGQEEANQDQESFAPSEASTPSKMKEDEESARAANVSKRSERLELCVFVPSYYFTSSFSFW